MVKGPYNKKKCEKICCGMNTNYYISAVPRFIFIETRSSKNKGVIPSE